MVVLTRRVIVLHSRWSPSLSPAGQSRLQGFISTRRRVGGPPGDKACSDSVLQTLRSSSLPLTHWHVSDFKAFLRTLHTIRFPLLTSTTPSIFPLVRVDGCTPSSITIGGPGQPRNRQSGNVRMLVRTRETPTEACLDST